MGPPHPAGGRTGAGKHTAAGPSSVRGAGGRYIEFYYWDSYFTAVGLRAAGRFDLLDSTVANMADLIRTHGFVPNGTRTYYLSRSQPPFFTFLLRLLAEARGESAVRGLMRMNFAREHAFWSRGGAAVTVGDDPSDVLNRYWDDLPEPRPEGYREDRATWHEARDAGLRQDEAGVYRDPPPPRSPAGTSARGGSRRARARARAWAMGPHHVRRAGRPERADVCDGIPTRGVAGRRRRRGLPRPRRTPARPADPAPVLGPRDRLVLRRRDRGGSLCARRWSRSRGFTRSSAASPTAARRPASRSGSNACTSSPAAW
ncbi:MAG: trehalase family glycosidase [Isosphaeraceae bacterium]